MGHPAGAVPGARAPGRGCATTFVVVLGLVCALLGYMWWDFDHRFHRPPPDVAAFARADATRTASASAARADNALLKKLSSAVPWAVPLGTSVADSCTSVNQGSFGGDRWSPISCTRSTVLYAAFDGELHTRLHQLDTAIDTQGWAGTPSGGPPGTLTAMATWMGQVGGDPPSGTATPSPSASAPKQIALFVRYDRRSNGTLDTAAQRAQPRLQVGVAGRPYSPFASTGDNQALDGPPTRLASEGTVYRAWHPLSTDAVARSAYVSHHYVVAFSITSAYIAETVPTTPPYRPPTGNGVPPCYSGSHCP
jgi:hypothetical protein